MKTLIFIAVIGFLMLIACCCSNPVSNKEPCIKCNPTFSEVDYDTIYTPIISIIELKE